MDSCSLYRDGDVSLLVGWYLTLLLTEIYPSILSMPIG